MSDAEVLDRVKELAKLHSSYSTFANEILDLLK